MAKLDKGSLDKIIPGDTLRLRYKNRHGFIAKVQSICYDTMGVELVVKRPWYKNPEPETIHRILHDFFEIERLSDGEEIR